MPRTCTLPSLLARGGWSGAGGHVAYKPPSADLVGFAMLPKSLHHAAEDGDIEGLAQAIEAKCDVNKVAVRSVPPILMLSTASSLPPSVSVFLSIYSPVPSQPSSLQLPLSETIPHCPSLSSSTRLSPVQTEASFSANFVTDLRCATLNPKPFRTKSP